MPFLALLGYGVYSILEVIFPRLRNSDFNRWEIDADSGNYIQILGWRKMLSPPRALARGRLSDRAACNLSLAFGIFLITIAVVAIRHIAGFPSGLPDLVGNL